MVTVGSEALGNVTCVLLKIRNSHSEFYVHDLRHGLVVALAFCPKQGSETRLTVQNQAGFWVLFE